MMFLSFLVLRPAQGMQLQLQLNEWEKSQVITKLDNVGDSEDPESALDEIYGEVDDTIREAVNGVTIDLTDGGFVLKSYPLYPIKTRGVKGWVNEDSYSASARMQSFARECNSFKQLSANPHKNILSPKGVYYENMSLERLEMLECLTAHNDHRKRSDLCIGYVVSKFWGEPLSDRAVDPDTVPTVFSQIYTSVRHLHLEVGLAHYDLSPANFLINGDEVKLFDFDTCASVHKANHGDGRPLYTPPCWFNKEKLCLSPKRDFRADIYALGVMLYQMSPGAKELDDLESFPIDVSDISDCPHRGLIQGMLSVLEWTKASQSLDDVLACWARLDRLFAECFEPEPEQDPVQKTPGPNCDSGSAAAGETSRRAPTMLD